MIKNINKCQIQVICIICLLLLLLKLIKTMNWQQIYEQGVFDPQARPIT